MHEVLSTSAAIYFLIAIVVLISNIISYFFLEKSHLFQIYSTAIQEINNDFEPLSRDSSSSYNDSHTASLTELAIRQRLYVAWKHTKWYVCGILLTFTSTLTVFPAFLSKIQPLETKMM